MRWAEYSDLKVYFFLVIIGQGQFSLVQFPRVQVLFFRAHQQACFSLVIAF